MTARFVTALPLVAWTLAGCSAGVWDNVGDGEPEAECDDGTDDDGDTLTDCEDPDCDGLEHCTWPSAIALEGRFDFDANTLGELGGAQDCTVQYVSALDRDRSQSCPGCDRVFEGGFVYLQDDCPDDPDNPRPNAGSYGFAFTSATSWRVYFQDLDQAWVLMGDATADGSGDLVFATTDPVLYDGTEIGDLDTTYWFRESGAE